MWGALVADTAVVAVLVVVLAAAAPVVVVVAAAAAAAALVGASKIRLHTFLAREEYYGTCYLVWYDRCHECCARGFVSLCERAAGAAGAAGAAAGATF